MIRRQQVYRCEVCGNMVEVLEVGGGRLVCCGKPMGLQEENTVDAAREKHVPVATRQQGGWHVAVGAVAHPMTEAHLIQWIDLQAGETVMRRYLAAGEAPEAFFPVDADSVVVRAWCNLHGYWKSGT